MQRGVNAPYKRPRPALKRQGTSVRGNTLMRVALGEKKNKDATDTTNIVAAQTTATVILLNGIDDGTTATTRVGRRITMTSLHIRFQGAFAATTAGSSPIRLVVVYDKQANAATPATTDVFVSDNIYTEMNLDNSRRFQVLVDENIECFGLNGPASFSRVIWRDFTAKGTKPGLNVEFNANSTATITSITSGSVYAYVWQNGNIITAAPTHALNSRIRFLDV